MVTTPHAPPLRHRSLIVWVRVRACVRACVRVCVCACVCVVPYDPFDSSVTFPVLSPLRPRPSPLPAARAAGRAHVSLRGTCARELTRPCVSLRLCELTRPVCADGGVRVQAHGLHPHMQVTRTHTRARAHTHMHARAHTHTYRAASMPASARVLAYMRLLAYMRACRGARLHAPTCVC